MVNLLNLKNTPEPVIIEKVVIKKRSIWMETLKMITVVVISSGVIWAVSKADTLSEPSNGEVKNFSAIGIVDSISPSTLTILDAKSSDGTGNNFYTFNLSDVNKIEDKKYNQLVVSQIKPGDKVVVQGIEKYEVITIRRIISFSDNIQPADMVADENLNASSTATSTNEVATSTATSTEEVGGGSSGSGSVEVLAPIVIDQGSTTDVVASSTDEASNASSTATSTDEIASSTINTSDVPVVTPESSGQSSATSTVTATEPEGSTQQESASQQTPPSSETPPAPPIPETPAAPAPVETPANSSSPDSGSSDTTIINP